MRKQCSEILSIKGGTNLSSLWSGQKRRNQNTSKILRGIKALHNVKCIFWRFQVFPMISPHVTLCKMMVIYIFYHFKLFTGFKSIKNMFNDYNYRLAPVGLEVVRKQKRKCKRNRHLLVGHVVHVARSIHLSTKGYRDYFSET